MFGTVGLRAPVDYVVVQGRVTVDQQHLTGIDEARTAQEARVICDEYLGNL